ncbi:MAG TPA: hypothetical protein ENI53_00890 [Thermoplasmatales archaeon]|nr:hypothetical protein [Thermoplasmatales archaeon]
MGKIHCRLVCWSWHNLFNRQNSWNRYSQHSL